MWRIRKKLALRFGAKVNIGPLLNDLDACGRPFEMTKDRALIILGMSTKTRQLIRDMKREEVMEARRMRKIHLENLLGDTRAQVVQNAGLKTSKRLQNKATQIEEEMHLVDQAARNLLNGIRMQELSQDKSWKLGTRPRPEPSKWITKVRPKTKSISFLVSIMKPKKLIVTDPNGEITTEICTIHKDQIASLEAPIEFQDGDDQDTNHKNLFYPNLDKPI